MPRSSSVLSPEPGSPLAGDKDGRRGLGLWCGAHVLVDSQLTVVPLALPVLSQAGRLSVGQGALVASAFTLTALALQPVFGKLADRGDPRWLLAGGGLWSGLWLATVSLPLPVPALVACAGVGGLGVAAFHPAAASRVRAMGSARAGRRMGLFLAAGNLGWALPGLYVPVLTSRFGPGGLAACVAVGLAASALTLGAHRATKDSAPATPAATPTPARRALPRRVSPVLVALVIVVALRSAANFGALTVLPLWLGGRGWTQSTAALLVSMFTVAGVAGGLAGGVVSDTHGRRVVTCSSLAVAGTAFALLTWSGGALAPIWLLVAGAALLASFPVTLLAAQDALPGSAAAAAGLVLGLAVGIGSVGAALVGWTVDRAGGDTAVGLLAGLTLAAAAISLIGMRAPARICPDHQPGGTS